MKIGGQDPALVLGDHIPDSSVGGLCELFQPMRELLGKDLDLDPHPVPVAAMPVVVRASPLPETIPGQCVRRRRQFVVKLNDRMGEAQAIDTLCHEWAHALAWSFSLDRLAKTPGLDPIKFERACHDEAWGCAYSRVWRAYLEVGRLVA